MSEALEDLAEDAASGGAGEEPEATEEPEGGGALEAGEDEPEATEEPEAEADAEPAAEPEPPPQPKSPIFLSRPLTIGLTGGIAAGKSTALAAFERLGAATISSEAVVHGLLASEPLLGRLRERWGAEVAPERERSTAAGSARSSSPIPGSSRGSSPRCTRWSAGGSAPGSGSLPADAESRRRRGAAALRVGDGRRIRQQRRGGHLRRGAPHASRGARARVGRRARGAAAHPGGKGRAGRARDRERRLARRPRGGPVRPGREADGMRAKEAQRRRRSLSSAALVALGAARRGRR